MDNSLNVPDNPIIPYIEGDGIGVDISPVMIDVVDAAVDKAYGGSRAIAWMEIYTGEKAAELYGEGVWFPEETLEAVKEFAVSIKGPADDARGRRLPLAQRGPAPGAGSLHLPAPGALVRRHPSPVKNPGDCTPTW
jgi:isocitrate dehydrogenase